MAKVLVVEDNPGALTLMREYLQTWGHQVEIVGELNLLIKCARSFRPELILADVVIQNQFSPTAYKSLQEDPVTKAIPWIFVTCLSKERAETLVPTGGNVLLLFKPIDFDGSETGLAIFGRRNPKPDIPKEGFKNGEGKRTLLPIPNDEPPRTEPAARPTTPAQAR